MLKKLRGEGKVAPSLPFLVAGLPPCDVVLDGLLPVRLFCATKAAADSASERPRGFETSTKVATRRSIEIEVKQDPFQQADLLFPALARWGELWGVQGLEARLTLEFSHRLRTTLGRCAPQKGQIRLAAFLLESPNNLLDEVVCHEAAHAAVYELHGKGLRPHGPEWKALMLMAGYEPRARIKWKGGYETVPERLRSRTLWEHRCPVCQAYRIARRPVRNWRCAACHAAGLGGHLVVTRLTNT